MNNEEIKPVAISIIELRLSEYISQPAQPAQPAENSVKQYIIDTCCKDLKLIRNIIGLGCASPIPPCCYLAGLWVRFRARNPKLL